MSGINGSTQLSFENASGDVISCPRERLEFKLGKYAFYGVILIVSFIGNSFICINVWKRAGMKTVMNYFLVNLAATDLAFTSICLPFEIPLQENGFKWPYHLSLCKVIFPLQTMCAFASVFTLTAIGLSRHRAVVHPMKKQLNLPATRLVICTVWIASIVCVTPYSYVLEVNLETMLCVEHWPKPAAAYRRSYTMFIFIAQYLIPFFIIFWAYVRICLELRKNRARFSNGGQTARARESDKVLKMAIAVTVLFALCMLPNHVVWLLMDFLQDPRYMCSKWLVVANTCVFINSAGDPVVYTVFHERYREEFLRILPACCKRCPAREELHGARNVVVQDVNNNNGDGERV